MNDQQVLEELVSLLETNGIQVRTEPLAGQGGGLCTVRGQTILFLDTQSTATDSAAVCAGALEQVLDIETLYLKPQIREFIQVCSHKPGLD